MEQKERFEKLLGVTSRSIEKEMTMQELTAFINGQDGEFIISIMLEEEDKTDGKEESF